MSFLGVKEFIKLQEAENVIEPFSLSRLKNGAYELSLGREVFLTDSKTGKIETLNETDCRQVNINPGQFALLLTNEEVNIPRDKIAFISIKASEKLKGLINVSGFHVDPGFNDKLLFSVYNAGPSTIVLNSGEPYFPIWIAEMKSELGDGEAYNQNNEHYKKLNHIPAKYIERLKEGELASPKALVDKINKVKGDIEEQIFQLNEKKSRNEWLFKIFIGITAAIAIKFIIWDWGAYKLGYYDGKNSKDVSQQIKEEARKPFVNKIISNKIDSILNTRITHDTARR